MADKPEFNGWDNVKRAAGFVSTNAAVAGRAAGLWVALLVATIALIVPVATWLGENSPEFVAFAASVEDKRVLELLFTLPSLLIMIVAWPSVAVAWHRFTLHHETPAVLPFSPLRGAAYFGLAVAFLLFAWMAPLFLLLIAAGALKVGFNLTLLLIWIAITGGLLGLCMRLSLKLPAIAVSDRAMTLARSWRETETMWPGMLWGTVVLTVPLYIANKVIDALTGQLADQGQIVTAVIISAVNVASVFIGLLLYSTFLSYSYQFAVGDTSSTFE